MLSSNYTPCFWRKTKPNPPQSWHWRHNSDRGNATFWTQTRKRAVSSDSSFIFRCNLKSFFFSKIRLNLLSSSPCLITPTISIHFVIFYSFGLNSVPTERSRAFGRFSLCPVERDLGENGCSLFAKGMAASYSVWPQFT